MTKRIAKAVVATPMKTDISIAKKHSRLFSKMARPSETAETGSVLSVSSRVHISPIDLIEAPDYHPCLGQSSVIISLDIAARNRKSRDTDDQQKAQNHPQRKTAAVEPAVELPELLLGLRHRLVSLGELVFPLKTLQRAREII